MADTADGIVDWPRFNEIRDMVDPSSFIDIIQTFESGTTQHLQTMQEALAVEDFEKVRRSGHALRGGASNLGALQVAEMGSAIEAAALAGDAARLKVLIADASSAAGTFNRAVTD